MSARREAVTRPEGPRVSRWFSIRPDEDPREHRLEDVASHHVRIVSTASALVAVCFVIITTLIYTHMSDHTLGDEIAWFAMAFFLGAIVLSRMAFRRVAGSWHAVWTDRLLFVGLAVLTVSMVVIGIDLY